MFIKKKYEGRRVNEATLMIRGGKATGFLEVVDRIAKAKNQARAQDMQGIFSQYMALANVLTNTDGLTREQVPGKPYYIYSVNNFLKSRKRSLRQPRSPKAPCCLLNSASLPR